MAEVRIPGATRDETLPRPAHRRGLVAAGLATAPGIRRRCRARQAQVEALRTAIAEQRAQLEAQAKLLEAQQAQLEALDQPARPAEGRDRRKSPRLALTNAAPPSPPPTAASSIALRANVQLDSALSTAKRRKARCHRLPPRLGRRTANRETNAARDFSEGFYFRRARFGVEGTIARDFNYRLLLELGGAAPKVRRASTTPGSRTPVSRRSRSSSARSRRPPTWTTAPRPKICPSSNAPAPLSCRARSAAPTAASASASRRTARAG